MRSCFREQKNSPCIIISRRSQPVMPVHHVASAVVKLDTGTWPTGHLKKVIPMGTDNPYAVRIVSDILESNGSSSMATVCAGCLALMDCGIKISKPVSGIAMGLITEAGSKKFAVLSDILGDEDHLGDMDFKVAGTRDGITATQMDIKVDGLSYEILEQALEQARKGRLHILDKMAEVIAQAKRRV